MGFGSTWRLVWHQLSLARCSWCFAISFCINDSRECLCESDGCSSAMKDITYHPQYLLAWWCSTTEINALQHLPNSSVTCHAGQRPFFFQVLKWLSWGPWPGKNTYFHYSCLSVATTNFRKINFMWWQLEQHKPVISEIFSWSAQLAPCTADVHLWFIQTGSSREFRGLTLFFSPLYLCTVVSYVWNMFKYAQFVWNRWLILLFIYFFWRLLEMISKS